MLVLIPLVLVAILMTIIIIRTDVDANSFILLGSVIAGILYLSFWEKPTYNLQLLLVLALFIIAPIIGIAIFLVDYFSKRRKKDYASCYEDEIRRKAFHFVGFAVFLPKTVYWTAYNLAVTGFSNTFNTSIENMGLNHSGYISFVIFLITYPLLVLFTITEFVRLNYKHDLFISLVRKDESNKMASYLHSTASIFIVSLLFYPYNNIVCAAIAMGLLADLAACIVGKRYHKIAYKDRSLEGFMANFLVGAIAGYFFVGAIAIIVGLLIATIDFLNGALELKLNDNFLFPVLIALFLYLFLVGI